MGLAIRVRYEYVNISACGLASTVGAACHGHQAWVYMQSSILHLRGTADIIHLSFTSVFGYAVLYKQGVILVFFI